VSLLQPARRMAVNIRGRNPAGNMLEAGLDAVVTGAPVYLFHAAQRRLLSYYDMLRVRAVCRVLRSHADDCLSQAGTHMSFPRVCLWLLPRARRRAVVLAAVARTADKLKALDLSALGPMSSQEFGLLFEGLRLHSCTALDDLTLPPACDMVQAATFLAGMTSLTRLDYSRSVMGASGTLCLQKTIQQLRGIRSLQAREVAGPAFPALVSSLSNLTSLQELVLCDSDFLTIQGGTSLVKFLTSLHSLDVSGGTNLHPDEVNSRAFGWSLGGMTSLTTLCLSNARSKSPANILANRSLWAGFAQRNVTGHALRKLAMRGNGCDAETCAALSSGIELLPFLEDLDLSDNEIDVRGVQLLAAAFLCMPLKILNLSENSLEPEGAVLLAGVFGSMTRLEQLDLTNTDLGEGTLELVSRGLPASLCTLRMGSNGMEDQSLFEMGRALGADTLPALECLELSDNNFSDAGLVDFAKLLESGRGLRLKTLNLGGNGFGDEGCSALAGELSTQSTLAWCIDFRPGLTCFV